MLKAVIPSKLLIAGLIVLALVCLGLAFTPLDAGVLLRFVAAGLLLVLLAAVGDLAVTLKDWQRAPLTLQRQLPHAFAIGVPATVPVALDNAGERSFSGRFQEYADPSLVMSCLPLPFKMAAHQREILKVEIMPTARGTKTFEQAGIQLRSRFGLLDLGMRIGVPESRRVFPNFETQARFAWLAGDLRVPSIGLKRARRRGSGTEFDHLGDYKSGDPIRHIDWKATEKYLRPIVRNYREERDQVVMFLLDCGRRMRADETEVGIGTTHFDQCLNALMLLAFIALSHGDAVGVMTFGTEPGQGKRFAPRKGRQTLNALMAALADVQPSPTYSDYERAAAECLTAQRKHGLIVMLTNSRNEDTAALSGALTLLRSRHVVMVANLRETVVDQVAAQELTEPRSALECAAAQEYVQARDRLMRGLASTGALTVDCTPERLGMELVNRYEILKRTATL